MKVGGIHKILTIVRDHRDPGEAWVDVVNVCQAASPNAPWAKLRDPAFERDRKRATTWVREQLTLLPEVTGIYLGLDTLNMNGGEGANIEFGGTDECDPETDGIEGLENDALVYGHDHLIRGLCELHEIYSSREWEKAFSVCDYGLFLGYSGLVLTQVFERLRTKRSLLPAWGFHDGDMFLLGRKQGSSFERICR